MDDALRGQLPDALSGLWDRLDGLDMRLSADMDEEAAGEETRVAEERSALLRSLCERIGDIEDSRLRESLLERLVNSNAALQAQAVKALGRASSRMATGAMQRRAIKAYGEQDTGA